MFVLVLALYNSVMTPFQFSFEYVAVRSARTPLVQIELTIDIIYLFDIFLGFTTSYIDQFTGDEYFGIRKIAMHYIKQDFIIDFLSTMWFYEFFKYVIRYEQQ